MSYIITPLSIALLLCGIFGIVWLRSNLISTEYSISELEKGRLEKLRETKTLIAEKSAVFSLQKAEKTAAVDLGLVFPNRKKVVFVKKKDSGSYKASFEDTQYGSRDAKGEVKRESADRGTL